MATSNLIEAHLNDVALSTADERRLARVIQNPLRTMEMYMSGDEIVICGAHFNFNQFMATLREKFPNPAN